MAFTTAQGFEGVPLEVFRPKWKITVGDTDISSDLISSAVKMGATQNVGDYNLVISNNDGKWTREFSNGDIIKVYGDYSDATNQILEGMLETKRYKLNRGTGFSVRLAGRDYGKDAINVKVTKRWTSPDTISNVWKYLITNKLPTHSTDFSDIANITTLVQPNWNGRPVWNCFQDLVLWAGGNYQFYNDSVKKWHLFETGSKTCMTENITYGENVLDMEITDSITQRPYANKVTVYGRELEGIPLLKVKSITSAPHSNYGEPYEQIITNTNLITYSQVSQEATNQLNALSTTETFGNVTTLGLPTALPGYRIWVINPYCNVMEYRIIRDITHNFSISGFSTTIDFEEKEKGLIKVLEDRYLVEQERSNINNPFNMEASYAGDFQDANYGDSGVEPDSDAFLEDSMSNTLVWENTLLLQLLQTSGTAISKIHTADENITECVAYVKGSNLESDQGENWVTTWISVNNGVTWELAPRDTLHTVVGTGNGLKIKVELQSHTTKIKALGVLYK